MNIWNKDKHTPNKNSQKKSILAEECILTTHRLAYLCRQCLLVLI